MLMFGIKRKITCALAVALGAISIGGLTACDHELAMKSYKESFYAMGTYATLTVSMKGFSETKFNELCEKVEEFLSSADDSLSASRKGSYIYNFNMAAGGESVEIDRTAYEVMSEAHTLYNFTGGKFNPAIWHNANAYHLAVNADDGEPFNYLKEGYEFPDEEYIEEFNKLSAQFGNLRLEQSEGKYYATKPSYLASVPGDMSLYSMRVDLGGIAKGWCADRVNEMMSEAGVQYGYFDFGTSSMAIKEYAGHSDGVYVVGGRDPRGRQDERFFATKAKNSMLSTSGDYEKYYEVEGKRYCHIIDPSTGKPIQTGVASVTAIGEGGAKTDALTSALSAMDKESAVKFINEKLSDYKIIMLVFEDGVGKVITNCPGEITLTNSSYTVENSVNDGKIVLG